MERFIYFIGCGVSFIMLLIAFIDSRWSSCKGRCKTGKGFNWVYKEKYNAKTI